MRGHQIRQRHNLYHASPNRISNRHNQTGDECGYFCGDTQWFTRSAWVDHECLFPIRHHDQLRPHHGCAESDWKHLPEYRCQHRWPGWEYYLSFSNCSYQQCRHQVRQRQNLYHAVEDRFEDLINRELCAEATKNHPQPMGWRGSAYLVTAKSGRGGSSFPSQPNLYENQPVVSPAAASSFVHVSSAGSISPVTPSAERL